MLKERIKNKEKLIGMYVQLSDISISRIAGLSGYDFIWIDTEHSYMSYETLFAHIMAVKTTGTPVIVRAPQDDLTATKKIVEMGVDGIIFPMVNTAEEANRVVASVWYPPYRDRVFGPMSAIDYGLADVKNYIDNSHNNLCVFIQIEHKDVIENLDQIMKNDFIDGYIFGPNDLSGSYNMLGEPFSEKVTEVMKETIEKLHVNDKYAGIASGGFSDEVINHWCSFNPDMIAAGADFDFIREGAVNNRKNLERLHKNK